MLHIFCTILCKLGKMNKAFIFDMDGVLIDSERVWEKYEKDFLPGLIGHDIYEKLSESAGVSMRSLYEHFESLGAKISKEELFETYNEYAEKVYAEASIARGVEHVVDFLVEQHFQIGLVSSSPMNWIEKVLKRLPFDADIFHAVISVNDRLDLEPKPAPDGHLEAMKVLEAEPNTTMIVEDSNPGIRAAKASGAFTIAYSEFLLADYEQEEADIEAADMKELLQTVISNSTGQ